MSGVPGQIQNHSTAFSIINGRGVMKVSGLGPYTQAAINSASEF